LEIGQDPPEAGFGTRDVQLEGKIGRSLEVGVPNGVLPSYSIAVARSQEYKPALIKCDPKEVSCVCLRGCMGQLSLRTGRGSASLAILKGQGNENKIGTTICLRPSGHSGRRRGVLYRQA
jgi:hypothetical protein